MAMNKKFFFEPLTAFRLLFLAFFTKDTIISYAFGLFNLNQYLYIAANIVFYTFLLSLVLSALPILKKEIKATHVLFYFACCVFYLFSIVIFPNNSAFLIENMPVVLFQTLPIFFLGIVAINHKELLRDLVIASLIGIVLCLLYKLYAISSGESMYEDDMDAAYKLLPSVLFILYAFFTKHKHRILYALFVLLGVFLLFSMGTRGPVLVVLVSICFYIFLQFFSKKHLVLKFFVFAIAVSLPFILYSDAFMTIIDSMSISFSKAGLSTRIFEMLKNETLATSVGRENIRNVIFEAMKGRPFGYGLMGDRYVLYPSAYAHDIFLELWCDFGYILGSCVAAIILYICLRPIFLAKTEQNRLLFVGVFCLVFVKLLLSSSFLLEPYFFLLIGMSFGALRKRKNEKCY